MLLLAPFGSSAATRLFCQVNHMANSLKFFQKRRVTASFITALTYSLNNGLEGRTAGYSEIKDKTLYIWSDYGTGLINCGILITTGLACPLNSEKW